MNNTLLVKVFYFGIEVEIISQMIHCSLIHFHDRCFVVDTADLVLEEDFKKTAKRTDIVWAA